MTCGRATPRAVARCAGAAQSGGTLQPVVNAAQSDLETNPGTDVAAERPPSPLPGTVVRAISSIYDIRPDDPAVGALYRCTLRDRLRKELVMTQSDSRPKRVREVRRLGVVEPVVAGDRVEF